MTDNGWLRAPTHSNRSLEIILWLGISQSDFKKILGNVGFELGHSLPPKKTRGPWATSLTWEKSLIQSTQMIILMLIERRKKPFFYFLNGSPFEQIWIPFNQGCFALNLVEIGPSVLKRIGPVVLEKKMLLDNAWVTQVTLKTHIVNQFIKS